MATRHSALPFEFIAKLADLFWGKFFAVFKLQRADRVLNRSRIQHIDFGMSRQFRKKIFNEKTAAHFKPVRRVILNIRDGADNRF